MSTTTKQILSLYNKMNKSHSGYKSSIGNLEAALVDLVEFDFTIFYQSSDGFVIEFEASNAPLERCLSIIKKKGKLTLEDYKKETI